METTPKRKILLLGKLPPPYMGPSVAFQMIINSQLKNIYNLFYLDVKANESLLSLGKWSLKKVFINLHKYRELISLLSKNKPELTLIPVSQSAIGFLKDSVYMLICYMYKTKIVIQLRGGNFKNWFDSSSFFMKWYVRYILKKSDGVIVQGNMLKKIFEDFFEPESIFVVPNGGDFIFNEKKESEAGKIKITYLGNLQPSKGIEDVIDAMVMLNEILPSTCILDVVGSWRNEQTKQRCLGLVKTHNLPVNFLNSLTGDAKLNQLLSSDIFVFPPREPEGHPWVIVEAMAAGLPIIATNRGAITESVIEGENGFIVPPNNPEAIAEKLRLLIENTDLRLKMGAKSRELYLTNFTEDHMVKNYSKVFDEILTR